MIFSFYAVFSEFSHAQIIMILVVCFFAIVFSGSILLVKITVYKQLIINARENITGNRGGEAQDVEANKACLSEETGRLLKSWMC